jgi:poly(rC)-binding protein 2/3/4
MDANKDFDFKELKNFLEGLEQADSGEQVLETEVGEIVIEVEGNDDNEIILLDEPESGIEDVEITIDDDIEANADEEIAAVEPVLEDSPAREPAEVDASDQYLIEQVEKALDVLVEDDAVKASDSQEEEEEDEEEEVFEDRDNDGIPDEEEPHGELPEDFHGTHDDAMALKGKEEDTVEEKQDEEESGEEVEVGIHVKNGEEETDIDIDLSDFDFEDEEENQEEEESRDEESEEEKEGSDEDDWF